MSDAIRVNGNQVGWGSIVLKVDGDRFYGFTAVSYGDKRERSKAYGMGRHHAPRGRTAGKYSTDPVKLTGWKSSVEELRIALAARAGDGKSYGNVEFTIEVQFIESGETPMSVTLERCVIVADVATHDESADPLKEELEIDCMLIRRNGKVLADATEGTP
jgi:hypothetical protein